MRININSETGLLKTVILGTAVDRSKKIHLNNPKYAEIVKKGAMPTEAEMVKEMEDFKAILEANGVEVLRPTIIPEEDQLFCRDIGFAVGNIFFEAKMKKENRKIEFEAIRHLFKSADNFVSPPQEVLIEGGDIIVWKDYIFVGLGDRTNQAGVDFLKKILGDKKEVIPFDLTVTNDGQTNMLHLDCAFQPVGLKHGIIYKDGFMAPPTAIYDIFGENNLIEVTQAEMYDMFPNIFSISPEKVVIEKNFKRLSEALKKINIEPIEVGYSSVSKLGGLLRCSTCPIERVDI